MGLQIELYPSDILDRNGLIIRCELRFSDSPIMGCVVEPHGGELKSKFFGEHHPWSWRWSFTEFQTSKALIRDK